MANGVKWRKWVKYKIVDYAQRGLMHADSVIYSNAQEHTPVDDGQLVLGARVSETGKLTDHFETAISYGNNPVSAEYAVIQHENMAYNHKPNEHAKFLEKAFLNQVDEVPKIIADYIRSIL